MCRALVVVVIGGLALGGVAGQEAKSGAKVGQVLPGPFRAYVVTGPLPSASGEGLLPEERQNLGDAGRVGKFHDFVTRYGLDPSVAVFSHSPPPAPDQPLAKLFAQLDQAVAKNRATRLHAFGIFLLLKDDFLKDESRPAVVKQIQAFAEQAKLANVPLALDLAESERTRAYGIAAETAVRARFDYTADKPLDDAGVQAVMAEVTKLVGPKR
jgi:hypothetical protein